MINRRKKINNNFINVRILQYLFMKTKSLNTILEKNKNTKS